MKFTANTLAAASGLVAALLLVAPVDPAAAQATPPAQSSAVKDMLGKLWSRLRAATPRPHSAAGSVTVTAGLRGAEATESELKPYWRGDREQAGEREALEKAQALADAGKRIEIFLSGFVPEPHALAAHEGDRLAGVGVHDVGHLCSPEWKTAAKAAVF